VIGGGAIGEEGGREDGTENLILALYLRHEHAEAVQRMVHLGTRESHRYHTYRWVGHVGKRGQVVIRVEVQGGKPVEGDGRDDSIEHVRHRRFPLALDDGGPLPGLLLQGHHRRAAMNRIAERLSEGVGKHLQPIAK